MRKQSGPGNQDDMKDRALPEMRRSFLTTSVAIVGGAITVLAPLGAGVSFLMSPLLCRRRTTTQGDGFVKLCLKASQLVADGPPQQVCVTQDRCDAWNQDRNQAVGNVWLRKQADGTLVAFSSTCPHLGCSVEHRSSQQDFFCPCHNSTFALDGMRRNQIPPRGMDTLDVRVEEDVIWIKYEQFRGGVQEKIAV